MGKRTNPNAVERTDREMETVLTFTKNSEEDDILNAPKKQPKKFPRPDDPENEIELPDFMQAAINSKEPLQVTEDPELAGTLIKTNGVVEPNKVTPPIQAALNELNRVRLEKKELLSRRNFQEAALKEEQSYYRLYRKRRAIRIPALPSGFKPYPEDAIIAYSPYTVQDLEDINNDDIPLYDKYSIMLEGIFTDSMSPLDLTFPDFTFISDTRHLQALGDAYFKYPYVCKTCGRPGTYEFRLSEIGFSTLNAELPLKVRFHTFENEVFLFTVNTIGDILHLLKTDKYWRRMGEDYLRSEDGKKQVDQIALNACRCVSHPWEEAYFKLLEISENPDDRSILLDIDKALYHDTEPIKFKCTVPVSKEGQAKSAEETAQLVKGVMDGTLTTTTPNTEPLPPWVQALQSEKPVAEPVKLCGAENELDVLAGDIIIPFRGHNFNLEYGILSV